MFCLLDGAAVGEADELGAGSGADVFGDAGHGGELLQVGDGFGVVFEGRMGQRSIEESAGLGFAAGGRGAHQLGVDLDRFGGMFVFGELHCSRHLIFVPPLATEPIREAAQKIHAFTRSER